MIKVTMSKWSRDVLNRHFSVYPSLFHSHQKFYFYDPSHLELMLNCCTIRTRTHLMLYCSHRLVMNSVVKPAAWAGSPMQPGWRPTWARWWDELGRCREVNLQRDLVIKPSMTAENFISLPFSPDSPSTLRWRCRHKYGEADGLGCWVYEMWKDVMKEIRQDGNFLW